MDGQHHIFSSPIWISHLPDGTRQGLQAFCSEQVFLYDYLVTREDDKADFSIPDDTPTLPPTTPHYLAGTYLSQKFSERHRNLYLVLCQPVGLSRVNCSDCLYNRSWTRLARMYTMQ
jgi:hypothetical protein